MKSAPLVVIWLAIQFLNMQLALGQIHSKAKHHTKIKTSVFPVLPKYATGLEGFVPRGWKIRDTVTGNLNNDKAADAVIILEYRHKVVENSDETHPRILLIAFKAGDHYILKLQHNTFILHNKELYEADPYRDMTISGGALYIHFDLIHDGEDDDLLYKIRYQLNDFYLTEASHKSRSNSGYECSTDFNFLRRKYVYKSGFPNGSGKRRKTKQKMLPPNVLKKLSELIEPLTWEVFDDEVI